MKKSGLKISTCISYGIGNLGYAVVGQTVTNYFMFFGTAVLGISGGLIGFAIALSTLWDGVSDCIVGGISDRYGIGKLGHRNGYMLIASVGMALINVLLWNIPIGFGVGLKYVWILVGLLLLETFNTLFSTPFMALGNDMAHRSNEKTKLQVFRTIFFLVGIIIPSLLMFVFLPNTSEFPIGQLNPYGYRKISYITSFLCFATGIFCVFSTLRKSKNTKENYCEKGERESLKNLFKDFYSTFKNQNLRRIIFAYSLSQIPSTILTGVGMHFFTFCFLYSSKQITILLCSLIFGTIISQPIWLVMSKQINKKQSLIRAIYVAILGVFIIMFCYIFRFSLMNLSFYISIFAIFICGFGSGALYSLPISMFGDEIDKQNKLNKQNKTATFSGNLTFSANLANAFALFIIGIVLDLVGFKSGNQVQSLFLQTSLAIIIFLGVILPLIFSAILFLKVKLGYQKKNE